MEDVVGDSAMLDAPHTTVAHFEAYFEIDNAFSSPVGKNFTHVVKKILNTISVDAGLIETEFL